MKDKMVHFVTENRTYPLCFNLNVMEEIQDQYGSISAWGEKVSSNKSEPNIKDLKNGLMIMINEGIEIENEIEGNNTPLLNSKQVGRIISEIGFDEILKKVMETAKNSTNTGENKKNM